MLDVNSGSVFASEWTTGIVLFHACGITRNVCSQVKSYKQLAQAEFALAVRFLLRS